MMILNTYLDEIRKTPDLLIQNGMLLRRYPGKNPSADRFTLLPYGVARRIAGHNVTPEEYQELYGENAFLFLFTAALTDYNHLPEACGCGGVLRATHARKLIEKAVLETINV